MMTHIDSGTGFGGRSILAIGTARGVIEVDLTSVESLDEACGILVQGLGVLGIAVSVTGEYTLPFGLDPKLDQEAIFSNTDLGLTIRGALTALDPVLPHCCPSNDARAHIHRPWVGATSGAYSREVLPPGDGSWNRS
jgi:hypothetical protein